MADDDSEAVPESGGKGGKLKLMVIVSAALVFLLGAGGAGAYFMGLMPFASETAEAATRDGAGDEEHHASSADGSGHGGLARRDPDDVAFVDLPDLLVNLKGDGKRMRFLKLRVALEVDGEDEADRIRALTPRILDGFQLYLRSLEVDELQGSAALYRLKEDLMARINNAIEPMSVRDVLFKEMLVQ